MDWGMTEGITGLISLAFAVIGGIGWFAWFIFGLHADRKELIKDVEKLEQLVLKQSEQAIVFSASIHAQINDFVFKLAGGKGE